MKHFQKVKDLLLELEYDITQEDKETGIFVASKDSSGICDMILDCEGDILIMEQAIFPVLKDDFESYKKLLQMNRSLIHGSFILVSTQDHNIISFRDTLQLENLNRNELEESLNSLTFALVENMDNLLAIAGH